MALALSTGASTAVGVDAAGFEISNEYAMHALNRDVNGLLIYTKTKLDSTDTIEVNDGQGFGYNGFEGLALGKASDGTTVQNTLQSDYDESTDLHYQTNAKFRKYQQVRFDPLKLFYFINDDGMLVARYQHDYSYAASETATSTTGTNWTPSGGNYYTQSNIARYL